MKKTILAGSLLLTSLFANAHEFRHFYPFPVVPFGVGAVVGYELSDSLVYYHPIIYQPAPVVVQQPVGTDTNVKYYCTTVNEYYPAVQTCDKPWLKVVN